MLIKPWHSQLTPRTSFAKLEKIGIEIKILKKKKKETHRRVKIQGSTKELN